MIRVGILGAGIGAEHLTGYRALSHRFLVCKLCDLDADRAAAVIGSDQDIENVQDINAVLEDPSIDLVDICLPPHLHASVAIRVLAAGKHVICEKPLARSLSEVDQIAVAMEQAQKRVFPVFQYRYGLATKQLQALCAAGLAGRALVASLETHWSRETEYYAVPWRGTWAGEAGGAVLGHAIHAHDLLCYCLGSVAEVHAYLDTRVNSIETEDCAALSMRLASGALVTSSVTLGAAENITKLRFCFEGFTAESGTAPYRPAEDHWTFTARQPKNQKAIDRILEGVNTPLSGFAGFLGAVGDAVEGADAGFVSFADARHSIELVTAIYGSARQGRPVSLPIAPTDPMYRGWLPQQESHAR